MRVACCALNFAFVLAACGQAPADQDHVELAAEIGDDLAAEPVDAGQEEVDEEHSIEVMPIASIWEISESTDPFDDQVVREARSVQPASSYVAETTVQCVGSKITYMIAVFGELGEPIPFRRSTEMWSNGPRVRHRARVRLDDAEAERISDYEPRYDNAIEIASSNNAVGIDARHFAAADKIVLGFELSSGEATLVLKQEEPALRQMLSQCLAANGWNDG